MALMPWLKKSYTIILVPHAEAKFRKFKLPYWALLAGGTLFCSVLAAVSIFMVNYILMLGSSGRVAQLSEDNLRLTKENQEYALLTDKISHRLEVIEWKTKVLSNVAGVSPVETYGTGDISGYENRTGNERIDRDLPMLSSNLGDSEATLEKVEPKFYQNQEDLEYTPTVWPLYSTEIGHISSSFGFRIDPFSKKRTMHNGIDVSAPLGTRVIAPANGVVIEAATIGGYGKVLTITHHNGFTTIYGHLSRFNVKKGDRVTRGQVIGYVGDTGKSTSSHLHYEIRQNDKSLDPKKYILNYPDIKVWDLTLASNR